MVDGSPYLWVVESVDLSLVALFLSSDLLLRRQEARKEASLGTDRMISRAQDSWGRHQMHRKRQQVVR